MVYFCKVLDMNKSGKTFSLCAKYSKLCMKSSIKFKCFWSHAISFYKTAIKVPDESFNLFNIPPSNSICISLAIVALTSEICFILFSRDSN